MANIIFVLVSIGCCVWALFLFRSLLKREKVKEFFWLQGDLLSPNMLSLYGLCATVIGFALLFDGFFHYSLVFYALASFLDGADGSTARALDEQTEFGKAIDPLCDKFRYFSFLFFFHFLDIVALLPLLIFFVADLLSQFSRIIIVNVKLLQGSDIKANNFGKTKTVTADVLIGYCFAICLEPWLPNFTSTILLGLVGLSVFSTIFKIFSFENLLRIVSEKIKRKASVVG